MLRQILVTQTLSGGREKGGNLLLVGRQVRGGDVGSETTYDMGLLGADSASCLRTYVPYSLV